MTTATELRDQARLHVEAARTLTKAARLLEQRVPIPVKPPTLLEEFERSGWSYNEVAAQLGLTRKTVSQAVRGVTRSKHAARIRALLTT
jgi:hypothetical protein